MQNMFYSRVIELRQVIVCHRVFSIPSRAENQVSALHYIVVYRNTERRDVPTYMQISTIFEG